MLRCADGSFYTGVAVDVERRLQQHNGELAGGARYTSGRRPVELVWFEPAEDRSRAQQRESLIKKMNRREKMALAGKAEKLGLNV
ncbi:MAG: GIY-YIG nuclease family protein [Halioglobus sp.]